ncbi:MAG: DUF1127 domain-containing protein [Alphaproteobacteria bacterium]
MTTPTLSPARLPLVSRTTGSVRPASTISRAVIALLDWNDRQRARRMLLELDDRALRDVGLTRSDAVREADKPFWRV